MAAPMEFHLFHILAVLCLMLVPTHSSHPTKMYWHSKLPNTSMPQELEELLQSDMGDKFPLWDMISFKSSEEYVKQSESYVYNQPSKQYVYSKPFKLSESYVYSQPLKQSENYVYSKPFKQFENYVYSQPSKQFESYVYSKPFKPSESYVYSQPSKQPESYVYNKPSKPSESYVYSQPLKQSESYVYSQPSKQSESYVYSKPFKPSESYVYSQPSKKPESYVYSKPFKPSESYVYSQPSKQPESYVYIKPFEPFESYVYSQPSKQPETYVYSKPFQSSESYVYSQPSKQPKNYVYSKPFKPSKSYVYSQPSKQSDGYAYNQPSKLSEGYNYGQAFEEANDAKDKHEKRNDQSFVERINDKRKKYWPTNLDLFFLDDDLREGKKMRFDISKSTNNARILSLQVAKSIPFSSDKLLEILERFSIKLESAEGKIIKNTIEECEYPGIKGEDKYCATSLESLIDFTVAHVGNNAQVYYNEIDRPTMEQEYTIMDVKLMGENPVVCHQQKYPYAVYYCHEIKSTKVYMVPLVGADGTKVKAFVVCHEDTSNWNPRRLAFILLNIKPGEKTVCHVITSDALVWLSNEIKEERPNNTGISTATA